MGQPENYPWSRRQFLRAGALSLCGFALVGRSAAQAPEEIPLPALAALDRLDGPPLVSARGWAIAEGRTGRLLWGGRETAALPMASTTKIMTAWLVLRLAADHPKLIEEPVTFSAQAAKTPGSSCRLRAGDRLPARDLVYGLLLPSGNDAAAALAEHFGPRFREPKSAVPGLTAFLAEMNREAKRLRLAETSYLDPHGIGGNLTSARDLALLAGNALQNPRFRACVAARRHRCEVTDAKGARRTVTWENSNKLLDIEGYDGVKTGTTDAAGSCLVASARRGKDHLLVVVLGCTSNDSRYFDTRNLFRWAWLRRGHK